MKSSMPAMGGQLSPLHPDVIDERSVVTTSAELCEIGRDFYSRNWVLGTGGNFSSVLSRNPLAIAITATGSHKGALRSDGILVINDRGEVLAGDLRPSFEYLLHLEIIRARAAGAVLHTHSIWATILSRRAASQAGLQIEGYEMLKGLEGVHTHDAREWVPILPNSQDINRLASDVNRLLDQHAEAHGFLLERHGLYTWGQTLRMARRHVEIFEFLFEAIGRSEYGLREDLD